MIARAISAQWSATLYVGAVSLGLSVILARSIGPAAFGEYAVALAVGAALLIFLDGGFRTLLLREGTRASQPGHAGLNLTKLAVGHAAAVAVAVTAIAAICLPAYRALAFASILCFLGVALTQFVSAQLRAQGRFEMDAAWQAGHRTASAVLIGCAIWAGFHAPWQILLAWAVASVFLSLIVPFGLRLRPALPSGMAIYRTVLPFVVIDLATAIYFRSDMIILKLSGISDERIGEYAAAYRLVEAVILMTNPISLLLFRTFRQMTLERPRRAAIFRAALYAAGVGAILACAVYAFARPIVVVIYGHLYGEAAAALGVLAWSLVFIVPNAVLTQAALALDLERFYGLAAVLAACVNVAMNFLLVERFGIQAAAVATVATEGVLFCGLALALASRDIARAYSQKRA